MSVWAVEHGLSMRLIGRHTTAVSSWFCSTSVLCAVSEVQYVVPRRSGICHKCLYVHVRGKCSVSNTSTCIHSGTISGMSAAGRVSTVYSNAQHPKVSNLVCRREPPSLEYSVKRLEPEARRIPMVSQRAQVHLAGPNGRVSPCSRFPLLRALRTSPWEFLVDHGALGPQA
jgi:hypothetical protein